MRWFVEKCLYILYGPRNIAMSFIIQRRLFNLNTSDTFTLRFCVKYLYSVLLAKIALKLFYVFTHIFTKMLLPKKKIFSVKENVV